MSLPVTSSRRDRRQLRDGLFGTRTDGALVVRLINSLPPEWNLTTPFYLRKSVMFHRHSSLPTLAIPNSVFQSRYPSSGNPTAHLDNPLLRRYYCKFAIVARSRANRNVSDLSYGPPNLCQRVASRSRFTGRVSTPYSDGSTVLHSQCSHWHLPVALL
ncbi:hypothetical protein BGY98DRAFT_281090 [Russula aff. rugulosa BPL654]|jgi:hypothetical protein|nr:hypothetical protein BGY98DRAFT_281090 [Russula aff. rugulosa BPL654]